MIESIVVRRNIIRNQEENICKNVVIESRENILKSFMPYQG